MDILQAARQLNPGTSWNLSKDKGGNRILTQAIDGTPRILIPDFTVLDAIVASEIKKPTLEERIIALEEKTKNL